MTWDTSRIDPIGAIEGVEGFHLNVAPEVAEGLDGYRVEPATPQQVFAGESTVTAFLRFADEAEARSVLSAYWTAP
jgi:hypothetical protein